MSSQVQIRLDMSRRLQQKCIKRKQKGSICNPLCAQFTVKKIVCAINEYWKTQKH